MCQPFKAGYLVKTIISFKIHNNVTNIIHIILNGKVIVTLSRKMLQKHCTQYYNNTKWSVTVRPNIHTHNYTEVSEFAININQQINK